MDFLKFLAINPGVFFVQFDLVQGLQSIDQPFIMTIHFPHTRLMLGYLIENKTTREVVEVFNYLESRLGINGFKNLFPCTITDRGNEFNNFLGIESSIETGEKRTTVFYCDAYASHQKGAIENNHTLVRRVIPKGTSFSSLTQSKVNLMMSHINSYVRRVSGVKTPYQIFESIYGQETLKKLGITKIPSDQVTLNSSLLK